jgi:hypothetical protein
MTRRTAIAIGLGMPAWTLAAKEFWNDTDPNAWTEDERHQLLTKSPWARDAEVKYNGGPGGVGAPRGRTTGMSRRVGGVQPGVGGAGTGAGDGPSNVGKYQSIVRWESALPVREANHNQSKDDPAANYILNVIGDLPMLGRRGNDENEAEFQQRLDMLKQYTKLEKKGDPIYLVKVAYQPGPPATSGTLFYFERNDLISLHDGQVTFVTKLGPLDVKCKFPLKDMVYHGKLEL